MKGKKRITISLRKKNHSDVNKVEEINLFIINKKHKLKVRTHEQRLSSSLKAQKNNDGKQERNMQENNQAARKEALQQKLQRRLMESKEEICKKS